MFIGTDLSIRTENQTEKGDKIMTETKDKIEHVLANLGADVQVLSVTNGPTVSTYGLVPTGTTKVSQVTRLIDDLSLALSKRIRMAVVPELGQVSVEVPNDNREMVAFGDVVALAEPYLDIALGKDTLGDPFVVNLGKMPHLLIAGTTGSGKSICLHTIICSLISHSTGRQVKLIFIDPKRVEMPRYSRLPHTIFPVLTSTKMTTAALTWLVRLMEIRYEELEKVGARDIGEFNAGKQSSTGKMFYTVAIVDELADLMMTSPKSTEDKITRLAQMARAVGIHLVVATQRPSTDIVTGLIKANFPARIGMTVSSGTDSRVILDQIGAERLIGKGDMLFTSPDVREAVRVQGAFISPNQINDLVTYWTSSDRLKAPLDARNKGGIAWIGK